MIECIYDYDGNYAEDWDLLGGLYNAEGGSISNSAGNSLTSPAGSPSVPIPPTTTYSGSGSSDISRRRSIQDLNAAFYGQTDSDDSAPSKRCSHSRTVHFPDEEELVSGYHEAPTSPFVNIEQRIVPPSNDEVIAQYRQACNRLGVVPNSNVERQITHFHHAPGVRQEQMSLKGERVSHLHMETLEEIFRRVQFDSLDFEYTFLDDDCVTSLAEMLEFYDSTHKLNLSFNKQITVRGWQSIFKAVRNCTSLHTLNLRYTSLTDKALPHLCRALRSQPQPTLTCLHLENVNVSGKNLLLIVCALKTNSSLKELYLGENSLHPTDGAHLYQLIVSNTSITTLDLRNNELSDAGVLHICDALRNSEACARSSLTALVLWNNRLTCKSMEAIARALKVNHKLETINVGNNNLGQAGVMALQEAIRQPDTSLHRLGLQSTNMDNQCAIMLAECLADNSAMVRIDLRDNPAIGSAGLLALHSAMKMNKSITLLNLDGRVAQPSSAKDEFRRYFDEIREYCERNKEAAIRALTAHVDTTEEEERTREAESMKEAESVVAEETEEINVVRVKESEESAETNEEGDVVEVPPPSPPGAQHHVKRERAPKVSRSASLTCSEVLPDVTIQERLREMTGSTHSLDESTHAESVQTIKKHQAKAVTCSLHKAVPEWGSLPSLPSIPSDVSPGSAPSPSTPVSSGSSTSSTRKPAPVTKFRRFSVSPTSSTFDLGPTLKASPSLDTASASASVHSQHQLSRPLTLPVRVPQLGEVPLDGSHSAPIISSSLPASMGREFNMKSGFSPVQEKTSSSAHCDEELERQREAREREEREMEEKEKRLLEERLHELERLETEKREAEVKAVVSDLVNYVVYEETSVVERKRSLLLQSSTFCEPPDPKKLMAMLQEMNLNAAETPTPTTPSRMMSIAEDLGAESDEDAVAGVLRNVVREVLKKEKEDLRMALDRKRTRLGLKDGSSSSVSFPSTPV